MLIGFFTWLSTLVSLIAGLIIVGMNYAFISTWSHGENAVLLAQMGLLAGRTGDWLSVDAVLRKWLPWWPAKSDRKFDPALYFLPVVLAQFSAALMFFNAFYWKLKAGGFTFAWALSNNLRNQIVRDYLMFGEDIPNTFSS